ncbi:hypothetical protein Y1Q_0008702 [Alligator mississippiensis]|uniref:Reverse transcriptase/retrotransposon-derived protein RNase H-like domain-containing protein n=1 Tax=Alligator mississippiensis TaxID=8496 RepID=A0A151NAI0_ALLMI|nr:hypothetical protein Y1Q_0008702 [Alligator mississippiensis]
MMRRFKKLKQALCEEVVIHTPDFRKPFILQTDASETALGAVLTQEDRGSERPVAYASRKLLPAERRTGLEVNLQVDKEQKLYLGC